MKRRHYSRLCLFKFAALLFPTAHSCRSRLGNKKTRAAMTRVFPIFIFLDNASIKTLLDMAFDLVDLVLRCWQRKRSATFSLHQIRHTRTQSVENIQKMAMDQPLCGCRMCWHPQCATMEKLWPKKRFQVPFSNCSETSDISVFCPFALSQKLPNLSLQTNLHGFGR